jgi:CRP-like cAMP-binding protein
MRTFEEILAEHPFFKGLDEKYLALIAGCASNVRFDAGTFLFRTGDASSQFYLIRHGRIALEIFAPGRGPLTIQALGEGDILGWSWLVPPYKKEFDAHALELVRAVAFDGACLRDKCEADPQLGYELLKRFAQIIGQRLQATRLQLLDIYGAHS